MEPKRMPTFKEYTEKEEPVQEPRKEYCMQGNWELRHARAEVSSKRVTGNAANRACKIKTGVSHRFSNKLL